MDLADLRARRYAIAIAEADAPTDLDPNDPEARGVDPDNLYDMARDERG